MKRAFKPIDAVLLIAFGGPERPEDIRPFLRHVLAGRPVPPSRIEEVAHHYEVIGGRSPINALTAQQGEALGARLRELGTALPIELGMWHAPPFIADALSRMAASGARSIVGVVMAAFHDSATLDRYRGPIDAGLAALNLPDLEFRYAPSPEESEGFVHANAEMIRAALARTPDAKLVFTAHSVPTAVGHESGYVARYESAARRIADALGVRDYRLAYQSRSGRPADPWLEPDITRVVKAEAESGTRALVVAPIGFVCDHVEVLYDLDVEAAQAAQDAGIALSRASTVTSHPAYIDALAQTVLEAGRAAGDSS